jgi:hypothetical protein
VYGIDPSQIRYAITNDDVERLRLALLDDPSSVPLPDPRRYEGPRSRAEFLRLALREKQEHALVRASIRGT